VRNPQARGEQRRLEREAAPEEESNQVVPPEVFDSLGLLDQPAVLVDAIAGNVGSKVRVAGRHHERGVSGLGDLEDGAQFRVPHAELEEIEGVLTGQPEMTRFACTKVAADPGPVSPSLSGDQLLR
jgi:hypothetical protein